MSRLLEVLGHRSPVARLLRAKCQPQCAETSKGCEVREVHEVGPYVVLPFETPSQTFCGGAFTFLRGARRAERRSSPAITSIALLAFSAFPLRR